MKITVVQQRFAWFSKASLIFAGRWGFSISAQQNTTTFSSK